MKDDERRHPHARVCRRPHEHTRHLAQVLLVEDDSPAIQLFPGADLRRQRDPDRAEALLLGWWGLHQLATST